MKTKGVAPFLTERVAAGSAMDFMKKVQAACGDGDGEMGEKETEGVKEGTTALRSASSGDAAADAAAGSVTAVEADVPVTVTEQSQQQEPATKRPSRVRFGVTVEVGG